MLTVSLLLLSVAQINIVHKNFKTPHKPKHKNTKCTKTQQKKTLTHNPYLSVLFLPCGVGIFHCYMQLLLVFLFHRTDCSLPYLELGTAPSKWGVCVKQ